MCNSRLQIDDLLDMISSISKKKAKVQGNLRLEALLKCTYKWLDNELRVRQLSRKRKWMEIVTDSKKPKSDDAVSMEADTDDDDLLACGSHDMPQVYWNPSFSCTIHCQDFLKDVT